MCNIIKMVGFEGGSAGEEFWGREQAGAWSKDSAGQEAGITAQASGCVVPEPQGSMEDQATWERLWSSQSFLWFPSLWLRCCC